MIDFKTSQYCYFQCKSALMLLREQFCVLTWIASEPHLPLSNEVNPLCGHLPDLNLLASLALLLFETFFAHILQIGKKK